MMFGFFSEFKYWQIAKALYWISLHGIQEISEGDGEERASFVEEKRFCGLGSEGAQSSQNCEFQASFVLVNVDFCFWYCIEVWLLQKKLGCRFLSSLMCWNIWQLSDLPNEREVVYGALNKWIAWETEFPLIAAAKALRILRKRSQWKRVIQV